MYPCPPEAPDLTRLVLPILETVRRQGLVIFATGWQAEVDLRPTRDMNSIQMAQEFGPTWRDAAQIPLISSKMSRFKQY